MVVSFTALVICMHLIMYTVVMKKYLDLSGPSGDASAALYRRLSKGRILSSLAVRSWRK